MLAAIAGGAPSFALDATFYDEMPDRVDGTGVPELLHQVLSRRPIYIVSNRKPAGLLKHDTPAMYETCVGTLGHKDIARV